MKILVINCGSSSLKYQLLNMDDETLLAKGLCERIGSDNGLLKHERGVEEFTIDAPMPDHAAAIKIVLEVLLSKDRGVISDIGEIVAVGHRVVHGGEFFSDSVLIDDKVEKAIEACFDMAPLHNPPNLIGIRACKQNMPGVPQVAVFDTAFHQTMPKKAYLYALPHSLYETHKIRKYGFHGTSHKYVSMKAAEVLGRPYSELKIITCHLGNGASVCAIDRGHSVDTSMGFTPLEGLVMGTRTGDIDAAVVPYLMEKEKLSASQVIDLFNKKSGMLGLSGISNDFRDILQAKQDGNTHADDALEIYFYRVASYIGRYAAAMNGVDAIVFTAGLGENSALLREKVCAYLGYLGVKIDPEKNAQRGKAMDFSASGATVRTMMIPTNEELVIARDTKTIVG
ncbi:MAG: acetate kinase [Burkholderiales bacterium]|jgi:acetate kinase|nr:acetate kinase [Burkholderiales bacterium]